MNSNPKLVLEKSDEKAFMSMPLAHKMPAIIDLPILCHSMAMEVMISGVLGIVWFWNCFHLHQTGEWMITGTRML
jgi:hypothetical protein